MRSNPSEYRNLAVPDIGLTQAFDVIITPPKGTADGTYLVRLDIVGDGTVYGTWTAVVSVQCGAGGCVAREDRCRKVFPWLLIPG